MIAFTLKDAIQRVASNFENENKFIHIYSDELSLFASQNPEVIEWLHSKGRSFGVKCIFATQYITQLAKSVQNAVQNFTSQITFEQNPITAKAIVENFEGSISNDREITFKDVVNLEQYNCLYKTKVNNRLMPSITFKAEYFLDENKNVKKDYIKEQELL
jgi:hypothetical protein